MSGVQGPPWSRKRTSIKDSDIGALNIRLLCLRSKQQDDESQTADVPIVWERLSSGYRIVDLQLNRFMEALQFANYLEREPLCRAVGLFSDALSMKSVVTMIFEKMEGMMSFVALEEGTNDIVGVLIASFFVKSARMVSKEKGETLHQVMLLKNHAVAKANYYESMADQESKESKADKIVSIDILCVREDHQARGIGTALVRSCIFRSSTEASACVGEFTCNAAQTIAERLEFEVLYEIPYSNMELENSKFQVFETCQAENYSVACMAVHLSPPRFYSLPVIPVHVSEPKLAKKGKNAKKEKNAKKKK